MRSSRGHTSRIATIHALVCKVHGQADKLCVAPWQLLIPPIAGANLLVGRVVEYRYLEIGKVYGEVGRGRVGYGKAMRCRQGGTDPRTYLSCLLIP